MNDTTRTVGRVAAWAVALVLGATALSDLAQAETAPAPAAVRAQAAQSGSASASPRPDRSATPKPKPSDGERRRKAAKRGAGRVLHGETVVQTQNGTATQVVQRGIVTALTSTSITVRSADGYSLTWTRNADTRVRTAPKDEEQRPLRVGDDVMAHGVRRSASSVVARQVRVVPEGARDGRPDGPRGDHPEDERPA